MYISKSLSIIRNRNILYINPYNIYKSIQPYNIHLIQSSTHQRLFSTHHDDSHTASSHSTWVSPALQPKPVDTTASQNPININIITMQGKRTHITGKAGETLLEALKRSDVGNMIPAACHGGGMYH